MINYRLRIVRNGVEFEAEGDKKFVLDMLNRFEKETKHGKSPAFVESSTDVMGTPKTKGLSPGEFIRKTGLKKEVDIVLAFGYYLEKYNALQSFSPADINRCYYEAKMEPSNTSQYVIYLIKKGHLMEAKQKDKKSGRKEFVLTNTGEEYITAKINPNPKEQD